MDKDELIILAKSIAASMGLYPPLICAIIERESSWIANQTRFEPEFEHRYILSMNLPEPETSNRATSFGLMQILGESARESGYQDELEALLDPATNIMWGCKWFIYKLYHASDVEKALQSWNGGGNPNYAKEVIAMMPKYV